MTFHMKRAHHCETCGALANWGYVWGEEERWHCFDHRKEGQRWLANRRGEQQKGADESAP